MKKVLITGKNSYIGTHLKQKLDSQKGMYIIDELDLHNPSWRQFNFSKYDVVFHVAGLAHSTPRKSEEKHYYEINTDLAYEVGLKASNEGVRQFIFMSSVIVYGKDSFSSERIIKKQTPVVPDNFYGDSKRQAEIRLKELENENFKLCIIRAPMIYGEGSKGNYKKISKLSKLTPIFPNFKNQRSMLYIGNLTEFLKEIIDLELNGLFFPQNSAYVETRNLVKTIALINNHNIFFTKLFNPIIRKCKKNIFINKIFGDLVIDQELSTYSFKYNVYNFEDSIKQTEMKR